MTDQNVTPNQPARVFKIGATRIVEDASMSSLAIVTWNMMNST
jgi:hypothetical protein